MILPSHLLTHAEWVFLGPMGPRLPSQLLPLPLLTVDGGGNFAKSAVVWVGDQDSLNCDIQAEFIFRHPREKDLSDLALALGLFTAPLRYKFHFWGLLGGRRDHELFNLGEALRFLELHNESQIFMYNEEGRIRFHLLGAGRWTFAHQGLFSLGTMAKTEVLLSGACRYVPQTPVTLFPLSSTGLSNEAHGPVNVENRGPIFIYFPGEK